MTLRLLVQRVKAASVTIWGDEKRSINQGLCVFCGVTRGDDESCASWLAGKIVSLRLFEDSEGKTNRSLSDIDGQILLVSQFSLYASCDHGKRPSFTNVAGRDEAERLYDYFVQQVKSLAAGKVVCGQFGADMEVQIICDGPLTLILEREKNEI